MATASQRLGAISCSVKWGDMIWYDVANKRLKDGSFDAEATSEKLVLTHIVKFWVEFHPINTD